MDDRNTIVIERNLYTSETKYLWKNDDVANTLSDLSENIKSPFSRTKPDYKKFSTGLLKETAQEVVRVIDEVYNKSGMGLCIEVRGTKEDYLAIKNVIEAFFYDRHLECTWSEPMQLKTEIVPNIKTVYHDLHTALSESGEIIELNDRNDEKGWLRSGFNWEKITDEKELYRLCAGAGAYLEKVTAQIGEELDRSSKAISELERELEERKAEESPETGEEINIDKLSKIMKKTCKKYTNKCGRELEELLKDLEEKTYLDETRIAELVRDAVVYVDNHQSECEKIFSRQIFVAQNPEEERRKAYILKVLADCLHKDIREYINEVNATGIAFGDRSIEEIKKKVVEEIYDSKEFTDGQKEAVRQWFFCGGETEVPYDTLKLENQTGENQFQWTKRTFEERDICREYKSKLRKALKDRRNNVLDGNSKVFETWGDAFLEAWKSQDANAQSDRLQYEEKLREQKKCCQERSRKLTSLQELFQRGREKMEGMFSFQKS